LKGSSSIFVGNGKEGNQDGKGPSARFNNLRDIAIDQQTGNLFVSDYANHNIRKISPQGSDFLFANAFFNF
jgi:NHL repeat